MDRGTRPGGLTALAVINFVLAAWGMLEVGSVAMAAYAKQKFPHGPTEGMDIDSMDFRLASIAAEPGIAELPMDHLLVLAILAAMVTVLLIISGVGYLLQHPVLGYAVGCVYAVGSIGSKMFSFVAISPDFHIGGVLVLIYPVLTLYLLNSTFRADFVPRRAVAGPNGARPPVAHRQGPAAISAEIEQTASPLDRVAPKPSDHQLTP